MKCYKLLLALFMVALKCGANEEPSTVNSIVENVTNSEVFNVSASEVKLPDFNSSSEANEFENTFNHATDDRAGEDKKKKFGAPVLRELKQGTRIVKNVIGSWIKELARPNETDSEKDVRADCDKITTMNYSKVENFTNSEFINASTIETPDNFVEDRTELPNSEEPVVENTLIKASNANAVGPFKKTEFGKLPIPTRLHQQKIIQLMANIKGSLMDGIAQFNEPDTEEEESAVVENATTVKYATDLNNTSGEVLNASTLGVPENSTRTSDSTNCNTTNANAVGPFKKKEYGKLPIPSRLHQHQGIRLVVNIKGSLMDGIAQLNNPDTEEEEPEVVEKATTVNYATNLNNTSSEVSNANTVEVPENSTRTSDSTKCNTTNANAVSPFMKKEFGKLPIPSKLHLHQGIRLVGSLMDGIAQLNNPDSDKDTEDDEPTTINNFTRENVTSSDVSNSRSIEVPDSTSYSPPAENTLMNSTKSGAFSPFTRKKFGKLPIPERLPQHKGIRKMTNIIGSLMDGIAQLNEPDSKEREEAIDIEKVTTVNHATDENFMNCEVSSTTEVPGNRTSYSPPVENTLMNATNADTFSPFTTKEFGKLPIPERLPQHKGIRRVTNIIGSLMDGIAQLNKPDSDEDTEDDESTTIHNPTAENVTSSEVFNAITTEAPKHCGPSVAENTQMNAANINASGPFKKKEFGIMPIPIMLPQDGTRFVENVTGSMAKWFVENTNSTKDAK